MEAQGESLWEKTILTDFVKGLYLMVLLGLVSGEHGVQSARPLTMPHLGVSFAAVTCLIVFGNNEEVKF